MSELREDARRLRSIAATLTYNEDSNQAATKHILYEVAMRLETGYYKVLNPMLKPVGWRYKPNEHDDWEFITDPHVVLHCKEVGLPVELVFAETTP